MKIRQKTLLGSIDESHIQLLNTTTHPKAIVKINKIYDNLIDIGITYGNEEWFYMSEKECISRLGQLNDLKKKPEYREFIRKGILLRSRGNNLKAECNSYYITEELLLLAQKYLTNKTYTPLSLNQIGDVNIQLQLPIETCSNVISELKINNDLQQCIRNLNSISKLYSFGTITGDYIDFNIPYKNGADGRLHSIFTHMSRKLRALLFEGFWDIDVDVAMPTLITQYIKNNFSVDMPYVQNYIKNKTEIRQKMATKLGVDIIAIKQLFNMPFNNAVHPSKAQMDADVRNFQMKNLIGYENIIKLHNDVDWCNYYKEIRQIIKLFKNSGLKVSSVYF